MLKRILQQHHRIRREHHYLGAALLTLMAIVFVSPSGQADANQDKSASLPVTNKSLEAEASSPFMHYSAYVGKGDSVYDIFQRLDLNPQALSQVMANRQLRREFRNIHAGHQLDIYGDPDTGAISRLEYEKNDDTLLVVSLQNGRIRSTEEPRAYDTRVVSANGVIESSLFETAQDSGLSDTLTMQLAEIFGWDIDFALDIRKGDSFSVIYEQHFRDGKKFRDGPILAARFTNNGRTFYAIRFVDNKGKASYYSDKGRSIRKAFLRAPVDFRRISSGFGYRYHPILQRMKRHTGVDYAARSGTPIHAAGDGKIIFRGRRGGYGNAIIIQHGATYSTLYGHMRNFARGLHVGSHVRQGQIIGYVGMTGLATGPHLHYEFRVNGVYRNPLTVHLPDAAPIAQQYRSDFQKLATQRIAQLNLLDRYNQAVYAERGQDILLSQNSN